MRNSNSVIIASSVMLFIILVIGAGLGLCIWPVNRYAANAGRQVESLTTSSRYQLAAIATMGKTYKPFATLATTASGHARQPQTNSVKQTALTSAQSNAIRQTQLHYWKSNSVYRARAPMRR